MINTVVSSSILILMVLTIRFLFKRKINPILQYGLWSLVALRLAAFSWLNLHPIESVLSVMNIVSNGVETMRDASAVEQVIAGNVNAKTIDNAVLIMDNVRTGVMTSGDGISAAAAIDWQLIFMIIWIMGTITFAVWLTFVNRKFGNKIIKNRKFLMPISVDDKGKILPVYVVESLDSPCLMGYRGETAIYVTSEVAVDKEKLHYAITHELCHYKHNDLIWSVVRVGLLALYWFNPLVWVAAITSKRDCELACDYGVIKELGEECRLIYGKTLMDLISLRAQKNNVFSTATTMYGSSNGIKERIVWIAKKKKMKVATLVTVILLAILSVGCTFTDALSNGKDLDNEEMTKIGTFATEWADAFSQRDAKTIYGLCENQDLYFSIGEVTENGEYWMGESSPWPWNNDYVIDIVDGSTIEIFYYFRTSNPTVYVAKETLSIKNIDGEYKAVEDSWKHFDKIKSKSDFDEAYKFGISDFTEFADAYQVQADDDNNNNSGRRKILENPVTAAIEQLNLVGAKVDGIYEDPYVNKAVVKFAWNDGGVTVDLVQPMLTNKSGAKSQATIWIVVEESLQSEASNV